ncbi:type IV pilus assembly protein PilV [Gammaproteobacteria bacterium]
MAPFLLHGFFMIKQLNVALGFSLIEILIAVFILAIGLLGVAGLYITSLKRTEDAYWRTLATSQLVSLMEQQKAGDNLKWSECENLLPHGECKIDTGKIKICWDRKNKKDTKQCL